MQQYVTLLEQTTTPDAAAVKNAEAQLTAAQSSAGFAISLLQILHNGQVGINVRQAGAIFFKNFIKKFWDSDPENGGVNNNDRNLIKENLLDLMLGCPGPVMRQLGAALEQISDTDYPEEWQNLLPGLVKHIETSLAANDLPKLNGAMETAHSVFLKFR